MIFILVYLKFLQPFMLKVISESLVKKIKESFILETLKHHKKPFPFIDSSVDINH